MYACLKNKTQMRIDEADHEIYNGWGWVSQSSFFCEVVQFLKAEEVQVSERLKQCVRVRIA